MMNRFYCHLSLIPKLNSSSLISSDNLKFLFSLAWDLILINNSISSVFESFSFGSSLFKSKPKISKSMLLNIFSIVSLSPMFKFLI